MVDGNMLLAEFIKIFPNCLLIVLVIVAVIVFRDPLHKLFVKLTRVDMLGVKMDFSEAAEAKEELLNAINSYYYSGIESYRQGQDENATPSALITDEALQSLLDHAQRIKDLLDGSRILWVDDQPLANAAIFRFLNNFGVVIDHARTTGDAISALRWSASAYEVVVSDMERGESKLAGLELLTEIKNLKLPKDVEVTVILFINKLDKSKGTPAGAKMITNNVEDLFVELFNIIERKQLLHSGTKPETPAK